MTVIYIDDFIHTRIKLFTKNVLKKLHQPFGIGKTAAASFNIMV